MNTFIFAANSVLPIILTIVLGYILGQTGFFDAPFLKTANKTVFRVALPVYLYYNIYSIDGFGSVNWSLVLYSMLLILVVFFCGTYLCMSVHPRQ